MERKSLLMFIKAGILCNFSPPETLARALLLCQRVRNSGTQKRFIDKARARLRQARRSRLANTVTDRTIDKTERKSNLPRSIEVKRRTAPKLF
jgi:hypothetical protein